MVRLESFSPHHTYEEVGELLGLSHHTLRAWYQDSTDIRDNSDTSGGETMKEEFKRLHRENRDLKRANGILKTTSVFRSESRLLHEHMISYITRTKTAWGPGPPAESFTKLIVVSSPHTGAERPPLACPVREL